MGQRIIIHLDVDPAVDAQGWELIRKTLDELGAEQVKVPEPVLPGIATAVLPDVVAAERARSAIGELEGVRLVELDQLRTSF
jgi:hypothetical protein